MCDQDRYPNRIFAAFGGKPAFKRATGFPTSTVNRWESEGEIPLRRRDSIIEAGRRIGLALEHYDFADPAPRAIPAAEGV